MFDGEHDVTSAPMRRRQILAELGESPIVSVSDLARRFAVSEMTIRRDLQRLEALGEVRKVHGGAVRARDASASARSTQNPLAKRAIAAAAARRVPTDATVLLDAGTTVAAVAEQLATRSVTIVTHSLLALAALGLEAEATAYLVGGRLRTSTQSLVGAETATELDGFRADYVFLGASAVDQSGFYNHQVDDVAVQRKLIEAAEQVWLLADSSKFAATALARVESLAVLTGIITDSRLAPPLAAQIRSRCPEVELVDVDE
jgi:DeoR/GlpR family transcriptional regulator of sugar metabolism